MGYDIQRTDGVEYSSTTAFQARLDSFSCYYLTTTLMIADTDLCAGDIALTLGNGTHDAECLFAISATEKDDLSLTLSNGLYANIVGRTVDLTALSTDPFSLIATAIGTGNYRHINITGAHTVSTGVVIDGSYSGFILNMVDTITINTARLFTITESGSFRIKGNLIEGQNNTLFYIPQADTSDRVGRCAFSGFFLKNTRLIETTNTGGYWHFEDIYTQEAGTIELITIDGSALSIPTNFLYFTRCTLIGEASITDAIALFFERCDILNIRFECDAVQNFFVTQSNIQTSASSDYLTFNNCRGVRFINCIYEAEPGLTLIEVTGYIRGMYMDGQCVYGSTSSAPTLLDLSGATAGKVGLCLYETNVPGTVALSDTLDYGSSVTVTEVLPVT